MTQYHLHNQYCFISRRVWNDGDPIGYLYRSRPTTNATAAGAFLRATKAMNTSITPTTSPISRCLPPCNETTA